MSDAAENYGFDDTPAAEESTPTELKEVDTPEAPPEAPEQPQAESQAEPQAEAQGELDIEPQRPKPPEFTPEQQEYINGPILGRANARRGQAEQKVRELEQQLEELQKQLPQEETGEPSVPEMPEYWDADYDRKLQERDEALEKRAQWRREQQVQQEQEQYQIQQAQEQALKARVEVAQTYTENAKKLGIEPDELQRIGNFVGQYVVDESVRDFIARDEQGGAITKYLSENIQEAAMIGQMSPMMAAAHIATNIKPQVGKVLRKPEPPPEPIQSEKGTGVSAEEDPYNYE